MTRHFFVAMTVCVIAFAPIACRGEAMQSECRFHQPAQLVKLPAKSYEGLHIIRRDSDPQTLFYWTGRLSVDETKQEVFSVRSDTTLAVREWIPYDADHSGHKWFASENPSHPLIESDKIRFEYLGRKSEVILPTSDIDGRLRFENRDHFTGTRRLMYGNRPLLEQKFTNWTELVRVETYVQIEPDGDRIILICSDEAGTRLAVFDRSELDADAAKR